jgi:hypothetical protein
MATNYLSSLWILAVLVFFINIHSSMGGSHLAEPPSDNIVEMWFEEVGGACSGAAYGSVELPAGTTLPFEGCVDVSFYAYAGGDPMLGKATSTCRPDGMLNVTLDMEGHCSGEYSGPNFYSHAFSTAEAQKLSQCAAGAEGSFATSYKVTGLQANLCQQVVATTSTSSFNKLAQSAILAAVFALTA